MGKWLPVGPREYLEKATGHPLSEIVLVAAPEDMHGRGILYVPESHGMRRRDTIGVVGGGGFVLADQAVGRVLVAFGLHQPEFLGRDIGRSIGSSKRQAQCFTVRVRVGFG